MVSPLGEQDYWNDVKSRKVQKPVIRENEEVYTTYHPVDVWNVDLRTYVQKWHPETHKRKVQYIDHETVTEVYYEKVTKSEYDRRFNERMAEVNRQKENEEKHRLEVSTKLQRIAIEKKQAEDKNNHEKYLSAYLYGQNLYAFKSNPVKDFIKTHPFILFKKLKVSIQISELSFKIFNQ